MRRIGLLILAAVGTLAIGWLAALYPLLLIVAVLVLAAAFYFFSSLRSMLLVALGVLVIGQIGRIPPGASSGDLLMLDGLVFAILLFGGILFVAGKKKFALSRAHIGWLGFLVIAALSFIFSPLNRSADDILSGGYYLLRLLAYTSLAWIIPAFITTKDDQQKILKAVAIGGILITLLGYVQLYLLPDIGGLSKYGWDPHVGRLVSTFLDPNYLGGYLALIIALVAAWAKVNKQNRWLWLLPVIIVAAVLTYSRSGYIAIILVLAAIALNYSWKLFVLAVLCVVPLALTIPRIRDRVEGAFSVDSTSQMRIQSWGYALQVASINPIIGVGYNDYRVGQESLHIIPLGFQSRASSGSDSSLLNVYATTGLVGLALFLYVIEAVLSKALQVVRSKKSANQQIAAYALLFAAPALFAHSFFVNGFFYPFILLPLVCLVGVLYATPESSQ